MTVQIQNPHISKLLTLSDQDAAVLNFQLPDSIFGFHAQQSFEKLFKAFLSAHEIQYPFTHNLETLLKLLGNCGERFPPLPFDPLRLQSYAVEFRYDVGPVFGDAERATIRESIAQATSYACARIIALEQATQRP